MAKRRKWEFESLEWIHRVREEHYLKTRNLPLESWLRPADPKKVRADFVRLGLKVRLPQASNSRRRKVIQGFPTEKVS